MDNFVGEIRLFPYNRELREWIPCNGQMVDVSQYTSLYSLLGTQFGGDGKKTFGIPNLNGRTVIGTNDTNDNLARYEVGDSGGLETVVLQPEQMPFHNHLFNCSDSYTTSNPMNNFLSNTLEHGTLAQSIQPNKGNVLLYKEYQEGMPMVPLNAGSINETGEGFGHENRMNFLTLVYCIATCGLYPPRS
jgi:microcystin-dependent protein